MKTLYFIIISLLLTNSFASFMASSSFPPDTDQTLLSLPENTESLKRMRVLIFPHTLRNDWRHGRKDDPTSFILQSNQRDLIIEKRSYKELKFKKEGSDYRVFGSINSRRYREIVVTFPIKLNLKSKTRLIRLGNEEKSSDYLGELRIKKSDKGFRVINEISLRNYLRGVVPSESSPSWPLESLKAQAVAARSYAVFHKLSTPTSRDYDVDDTARYQVYTGVSHVHPRTDQAVKETLNEVLTYNEKIIIAFFHAYSGGETDSAKNIFKINNIPYCRGTVEDFSNDEIKAKLPSSIHWVIEWNKKWEKTQLIKSLKSLAQFKDFDENKDFHIEVLKRNATHGLSIKEMLFSQENLRAKIDSFTLRSTLGWSYFNSYHFFIDSQDEQEIAFKGLGWGHHVGMSQWSAYYMAKYLGASYQQILEKFYYNTKLKEL